MNIDETLKLIQALRLAGVTHYKSTEHDISLNTQSLGEALPHKSKELKVDTSLPHPAPPLPEQVKAVSDQEARYNAEATEKIKDMIKTLKMDHTELANHMFPEDAE